MFCKWCGEVDDHYDEGSEATHYTSPKHICNAILCQYKNNKRFFSKNKDGIFIHSNAESKKYKDAPIEKVENCDQLKTRIYAQPKQKVKFSFKIRSDLKNDNVFIIGIQLAHPQPQFVMNNHCYVFGEEPHILGPKTSITDEVSVSFTAEDIGQYEMPIMFTFHRPSDKKNLIFVREMVVMVQETIEKLEFPKTPFTNENWGKAKHFIPSTVHTPYEKSFPIPKALKILLPMGLDEDKLNEERMDPEKKAELREILITTRGVLEEGITEANYVMFFHYLLWWEEIAARISLRKYNMAGVTIEQRADGTFWLEVPGLAEKRPSLLRGDRAYLRPTKDLDILFECIISNLSESSIQLHELDERFDKYYSPAAQFNVRFLMSRVPMERMHAAVGRVFEAGHGCRILPRPAARAIEAKPITKFYNQLIKGNEEQRSAVEHIVSKTSGKAPYIVFGPPGTGKTMTIVEAIIQIVVKNPRNRVLVCTDSNMAADHIALMLLQFNKQLNINKFILRANSQNREWSIMPPELVPVSNGASRDTFSSVTNDYAGMFRVLVTTLLHAAKYGESKQWNQKLQVSHLFIDEAAQAKEPAALVPISSLLAPAGQLVLAGDPQQLGPVCVSRQASERGLGVSLLERLWLDFKNLYEGEKSSAYITTLVQNYRSDPDILHIPNQLFYPAKPLEPRAKPDPLSKVSILGLPGGDRAVVFHSVNSREQRMGKTPSFFNEKELMMLQRYTRALILNHNISPKEIGIIAPYIRQVYKMRDWLKQNEHEEVEVGTVEAFQGKEKRVILVSTVRANCRLLDYDARYGLGFLVDDKRFNVTLTRAKAKLVIIGNPACLTRDVKWRLYMDFCKKGGCYFGQETEQLQRTAALLTEVARTRFERCRITAALKEQQKQ